MSSLAKTLFPTAYKVAVGQPGQMEKLRQAAEPLLKLLNDEYDPHHTVIVTPTSVELMQGIIGIPKITEHVKD